MAEKAKRKALITPRFRVSFPEVFTAKAFQEGQKARWSLVALFTPATFTEDDKLKWRAIIEASNRVAVEGFKLPMKDLDRGVYKLPFHKGEEKTYAGYGPGVIFCTLASSKRRPEILAADGVTTIEQGGGEEFYAGCYARASVNPYWFNNIGKGVAIGLGNLQKLGDGERLDAFTSASDDFGDDPAEYGTDDFTGAEDDPTA